MVEGHQGLAVSVLALGLTQGRPQVQRQTEEAAQEERDKLEAFEGRREVEHFPYQSSENNEQALQAGTYRPPRQQYTYWVVSHFELLTGKNGAGCPLPRSLSGTVFSSRLPDTALTRVR